MHFMIDYENVKSRGLQGSEYLQMDDEVTIFYSQCCMQIEAGIWSQLVDSRCRISLCKLVKTGKNALDFYIASRIGEEFGSGYEGIIAIISGDYGFAAVRDYWQQVHGMHKIVLRPTIEQAIFSSGASDMRTKLVQSRMRQTNIEAEFARYEERQRLQEVLERAFVDTEYIGYLDEIQRMVEEKQLRKALYLNSLKRFGKRNGLEIYQRLKQIV